MQRAYQNLSSRMVHKQITSIQVLRWTIPTYLHLQAVWFDVWNQRWSLQPYGQKSQEVQAIKSAYIPICDGLVSAGDDKLIWINNMESIGSCGRQAKLILVARNEIDLGDSRPRLRGGRGGHQAGGFGHSVPGQAPHWGFHLLNLQQSVQGPLRWQMSPRFKTLSLRVWSLMQGLSVPLQEQGSIGWSCVNLSQK